jgi:hypothetical protein
MCPPGKRKSESDYLQRELDDPVKKLVDDKLEDPFVATKKGEKKAEEELRKGAERAARQGARKRSLPSE